ncbi:structural protein [Cellulophaga phage phi47:1]|uniref:head closure Hc1 n=1 Tax=Cellulophaga phage phiSM TaxID=756280 RepID=UPI0002B793A2|nr:head closure Hc1 [Cellulophaga phage phiSM]AGF91174.1 hypothetical protein CHPG_00022 [Cellulophaga phage phi3:1]AGF91651.1 hypothetical protein CDPG_00047 [Cellulophaga phage phi47:1]AGO47750.1 structural protein [Cellulophaga phage phi3ST:2]AGO49258.1 structural protein [Cellulophaga phage phi38:2]AGH07766.1 hypothetical protein CEPG_00018 [Cellulophaga phage phiSM]
MGITGNLLKKARRDAKKYITKGGFHQEITITTPDKNTVLVFTGFFTKHWVNFNAEGGSINSKNAHFTFDEDILTEAGYPVRNLDNEVHLFGHVVSTEDSSGIVKHYVITDWYPDETLGIISCILGDYESDN